MEVGLYTYICLLMCCDNGDSCSNLASWCCCRRVCAWICHLSPTRHMPPDVGVFSIAERERERERERSSVSLLNKGYLFPLSYCISFCILICLCIPPQLD